MLGQHTKKGLLKDGKNNIRMENQWEADGQVDQEKEGWMIRVRI
jgi:hypothetical protein